VAISLTGAGSIVVALTLAVLEISLPIAAVVSSCTMSVKVALLPAASVDVVLIIVPVSPGRGVVLDQPAGAVNGRQRPLNDRFWPILLKNSKLQ